MYGAGRRMQRVVCGVQGSGLEEAFEERDVREEGVVDLVPSFH